MFFQPGRTVSRSTLIILMPAVLRPFPGVTGRIVQTESIRLERTHRRSLSTIPWTAAIAADRIVFADGIAPPVAGLRACPRGVFPFGLCWQAVLFTRFYAPCDALPSRTTTPRLFNDSPDNCRITSVVGQANTLLKPVCQGADGLTRSIQ